MASATPATMMQRFFPRVSRLVHTSSVAVKSAVGNAMEVAEKTKKHGSTIVQSMVKTMKEVRADAGEKVSMGYERLKSTGLKAVTFSRWCLTNPREAATAAREKVVELAKSSAGELREALARARARVLQTSQDALALARWGAANPGDVARAGKKNILVFVSQSKLAIDASVTSARARVQSVAEAIYANAKDPKVQATSASAAAGAVAMGSSGGILGIAVGGAAGTAMGLIPAVFTFGLSIPIGALIGSGAGFCVGTVAGSATGAVCGGAAGRGVYENRGAIKKSASRALEKVHDNYEYAQHKVSDCTEYAQGKVNDCTEYAKTKATDCTDYAKSKARDIRKRGSAQNSLTMEEKAAAPTAPLAAEPARL